ncbi:hypothetical protein H0A36_00475 [Endozoicomonas sp. SM1973]|uniref:Uncharacterized protein n=1 Tax=Spartinivicinus marinus TaxID=2994442 RepID=A0A853HVL8_9GAMM|nr:hypothetical protein [Spartinivicinus marinus]MCX4026625.1 hypothetical protein [Spartinivicinus marinus]NYZ64459.1 hypothetical protein [Spartinivicinus marinus]
MKTLLGTLAVLSGIAGIGIFAYQLFQDPAALRFAGNISLGYPLILLTVFARLIVRIMTNKEKAVQDD